MAFVAGKSGGHIVPCLTIARQYCAQNPNTKVLFFTTPLSLDKKIITQSPLVTHHEPVSFYYKPVTFFDYISSAFFALSSFVTALVDFCTYKPERLITTGGILTIPVVFAAFCLSIPIDMYVLDVVPGKTLIALEPFATTIYCCFESTKQYFSGKHVLSVPYPVRYLSSEINCTKKDACIRLGLDPKKKTLFILGGSQGSTFLNELIMKWVCDNDQKSHNVQIIHQYGNDTRHDWNIWYQQHQQKAIAFDFASNLSLHYAAADLVIARAGAGTIFELQAFNKKTILIPLQALSTDHQVDNAKSIVKMYPKIFSFLVQADVEKNCDELYQKINNSLQ